MFFFLTLFASAYGTAASEPCPEDAAPGASEEEGAHKSEITLWEASLVTRKLPSKRIITPLTSAFHGATLAFIGWTALMMEKILYKKNAAQGVLRSVHGSLLGSVALGSLSGLFAGLIYQRWGIGRWYGLLLRNCVSLLGAWLLAALNYAFVIKDWFEKNETCAYAGRDWPLMHVGIALLGFLVLTERIRGWRDRRVKIFTTKSTMRSALGRLLLRQGVMALILFSFARLAVENTPSRYFFFYLLNRLWIPDGVLVLLTQGLDYFFLCKSQYCRHYKNGIIYVLLFLYCGFFCGYYFTLKKFHFCKGSHPLLFYAALYDMVLGEVARAYYIRLLLRECAENRAIKESADGAEGKPAQ